MKVLAYVLLCIWMVQVDGQDLADPFKQNCLVESEQKAALVQINHAAFGTTLTNDYDLKYHRLELAVDPNVDYIRGVVTSYFLPSVNNFSEINFDLASNMTVDSVLFHSFPISFSLTGNDVLEINLPGVLPTGVLDSVTVYYQGIPNGSGFGSFVKGPHTSGPVIWTLSEPFGAKDWWPCKQDLNDKIDSMDILVTTPGINRVASNGCLVSETLNADSSKTYHWQTHYPIAAYLLAIGVTNYASYSDYVTLSNGDSLVVLNYVYPENLADAHSRLPEIVDIIRIYDSLLIDYPFAKEKYGHAQFGWNGGMEHQTMSFVAGFDHNLVAHECAHQWFGDYITPASWQDIWLNEGFATYFAAITEEILFPESWSGWKSMAINSVTSVQGGSVLCDDTTSVGRIFNGKLSYNKGAMLLHMLRWQLGDSLFFQSLREYLHDPLLAFHYAKTSDLVHHFEQTSGQDLTRFFNQWYYGQGYPIYHLTWNQHGDDFFLKLEQRQSHPSVSFFEMPVPVQLKGAGHDTTVVLHHTYSGEVFTVPVTFKVDSVFFDPQQWILSTHNIVTYNPVFTANNPNPIESELYVYPVPSDSHVKIYSTAIIPLKEADVYDLLGKLVMKEILKPSDLPFDLDISGISEGVYSLVVKTDLGTVTKKIIRIK